MQASARPNHRSRRRVTKRYAGVRRCPKPGIAARAERMDQAPPRCPRMRRRASPPVVLAGDRDGSSNTTAPSGPTLRSSGASQRSASGPWRCANHREFRRSRASRKATVSLQSRHSPSMKTTGPGSSGETVSLSGRPVTVLGEYGFGANLARGAVAIGPAECRAGRSLGAGRWPTGGARSCAGGESDDRGIRRFGFSGYGSICGRRRSACSGA